MKIDIIYDKKNKVVLKVLDRDTICINMSNHCYYKRYETDPYLRIQCYNSDKVCKTKLVSFVPVNYSLFVSRYLRYTNR